MRSTWVRSTSFPDHVDHRRVARRQPPDRLLVDEQDPAQHAVLAHQILRRGDVAPVTAVLGLGARGRPRDQQGARAGHARQELPPPIALITHGGEV
jgi:hypothetical protein